MGVWDPQGVNIVYEGALGDLGLGGLETELLVLGSYYIERGCGLGGKIDRLVKFHKFRRVLILRLGHC